MFRSALAFIFSTLGILAYSQNDLDAIRYARAGGGGSARFTSMGGAFGAVGADLSSASYNPAGLGLFRKGEISLGFGFRSTNNSGNIYNKNTAVFDLNGVFNNFGLAVAWSPQNDPDSRHVLSFTNNQLQNFNSSIRISGYTNNSSIAKDMLNLAEMYKPVSGNVTQNLNNSYEGLAYNTYLLDVDNGKYFSFVDLKRSVKQTRDIVTSGRMNDLNFSYAYSYKDKFYLGASIGIPQIRYESSTTHYEQDDKDSMRIVLLGDSSFTDTYVDPLPILNSDYDARLGFKSLEYTEYFKTTGSGINLKLGGIARVTDFLRVGFYYHTPTFYSLEDTYYNTMNVFFDRSVVADYSKSPKDGGYYKYKLITPGKVSLNAAFIIKKLAVIGVDYEFVNYRNTLLRGESTDDFAGTNTLIKTKYSAGQNLRIGGELKLNPIMIRLGYNMQGSPFGDVFSGSFVRNTFSAGIGFRSKKSFYCDLVVYKTLSQEDYYLYTTLNTKATLKYNSTTAAVTFGFKF